MFRSRIFWLVPVLVVFCSSAFAQAVRAPARMLVGFPPGGNVDLLGRMFVERLGDAPRSTSW